MAAFLIMYIVTLPLVGFMAGVLGFDPAKEESENDVLLVVVSLAVWPISLPIYTAVMVFGAGYFVWGLVEEFRSKR